jgi:hypothetical protein
MPAAEQLPLWGDDEPRRPVLAVVHPDPWPRSADGRIQRRRCRCCRVPIDADSIRCTFCADPEVDCRDTCGPLYARVTF